MKSSNPIRARAGLVAAVRFAAVLCVTTLLLHAAPASAQLTGIKNIPGDYATLEAAITDLNTQGVGAGGVTMNVVAANPQTAPAGGYAISTTTGSAANPIALVGNGNTITAFTPQVAGNLNDALIKIIGTDFVTISGFTLLENAANTTTAAGTNNMTEWGVALLYATTTDGAQNATIQNNTIDLNRTYQNTFGIYSNSTHAAATPTTSATATTPAGANSGLTIYGNSITDVNIGIVVVGPTAAADHNNGLDIGGLAAGTGNQITNYGTTGTFSGYANVSGTVNGVLVRNTKNYNVSFNTIASSSANVVGTTRGVFVTAFNNAPTGTVVNNINNNSISVRSSVAAGAIQLVFVDATTNNATTTMSVSDNDFNTIGHAVAASGAITFISVNSISSLNVNNNTFSNLSVNTTGAVIFITRSGDMPSGAIENVNNNRIVGTFAKTGAAGAVTFFTGNASSVNGSQMISNNNNFSNITLAGTASIAGWSNTEGASSSSGPTKTLTGNTFTNITGGSGAIVVMALNFGAATTVSNTTIASVTGGGAITGITIGTSNSQGVHAYTGNSITGLVSTGTGGSVNGIVGGATTIPTLNISGNTISGLSSTVAAGSVAGIFNNAGTTTNITNNTISALTGSGTTTPLLAGIAVSAGTTANVSKNKIFDLQQTGIVTSATAPITTGLLLTGGTTVNAFNNLIGDLRAPAASGADLVRGISIGSSTANANLNLSFNTVLLSASSSGANFGSSALLHTVNATATTANLNLRNNILVNNSTPAGTGLSVAYRRSGTALNNFGAISNNNDYYAGAPGASNLIFFDGTNADQTIAAYRARVSPRDSNAVSSNPTFLSTSGASAQFLHIDPTVATPLESGGVTVAGITDDFDGDARNATTPDIGADEFTGILLDVFPPTISYSALGNTALTTDRVLTVTITDFSGIAGGALSPRIYFRKNADAYQSTQCTGTSPTYSCTISSAAMGGLVTADVVSYFVVAQDTAGNVGANPSAGFSATDVNTIITPPTTPNAYTIVNPFPSTVQVGTGETFTSLTNTGGLFEALNTSVLTGDVTVSITSDLAGETGTFALNQLSEDGAGGYSLTITSSAAVQRLISGSTAVAMIRLNGADRVVFDGRFNLAGRFLRVRNANTANPTFLLQNDATNNLLQNLIVESANTGATSGTIVFGTSAGTLGNSQNQVNFCEVRDRSDATGFPANGILSLGTAGAPNTQNMLNDNEVHDFTAAGIALSAGTGDNWSVGGNSLYSVAPRTTAITGILVAAGSAHSIDSNVIGGTAPLGAGSFLATSGLVRGIDVSVGTAQPTLIAFNSVLNIRSTSTAFTASYGIFAQAGQVRVLDNRIGGFGNADRYEINGDSQAIRVISAASSQIGRNLVQNFATPPTAPTGQFYFGISAEGTGSHEVFENTVFGLTNSSVPDSSFSTQTIGLFVSATGAQNIRNNEIAGFGSTSTAAPTANNNRVWGMILSGTGVGTRAESNVIQGGFASSAGTGARRDVVTLIQLEALANATLVNNMASTNGGAAGDRAIFGILDLNAAAAAASYSFNSVNIHGTATGATTYAFNRNGVGAVTLRNNIFSNVRTGGSGFHVAMANTNAAATGWPATASDFNILFNANDAHLTQWLGSLAANNMTLAQFRTASGGDANSLNVDPLFVGVDDLHIGASSPANQAGTPVAGVTTDIDGQTRSTTAPDIGADEFNAPPTITGSTVSRKAGDAASTSTVATVADVEDLENTLNVTVNGGASATLNGVTVSSLTVNAAGDVSASVGASCSATDATFTLRVTDSGGQFAEAPLTVTITPNTAPVLTYATVGVQFGQSGNINPATGPSDSGSIASITIQSPGTFAGTLTPNVTGVIAYGNAAPIGPHMVTVRATDNCGLTTDAPLVINVGQGATTTTITSDSPDPSLTGQNVTVAWTVSAVAPASGTPTGTVSVSDGVANCSASVAAGQCTLALTVSGVRTLTATYSGDVNFTGSSDTEQHVVGDQADLSISKTSSLALIGSGLIQYTIVVSNAGPSGVMGATVQDTLPPSLTGATWTCAGTFGATCTPSGTGNINDTVNLPANSSVVYSLTASVPLPFNTSITNTATVAAPAGTTDPVSTNNSSSVTNQGDFVFADGFEDAVIAATRPATPGTTDNVTVPATALRDIPLDLTPRIAMDVTIGSQRVWLMVRVLDGALQTQIVMHDGVRWSAGEWTTVDIARALVLAWTVDRAGVIDVRLEQH